MKGIYFYFSLPIFNSISIFAIIHTFYLNYNNSEINNYGCEFVGLRSKRYFSSGIHSFEFHLIHDTKGYSIGFGLVDESWDPRIFDYVKGSIPISYTFWTNGYGIDSMFLYFILICIYHIFYSHILLLFS